MYCVYIYIYICTYIYIYIYIYVQVYGCCYKGGPLLMFETCDTLHVRCDFLWGWRTVFPEADS